MYGGSSIGLSLSLFRYLTLKQTHVSERFRVIFKANVCKIYSILFMLFEICSYVSLVNFANTEKVNSRNNWELCEHINRQRAEKQQNSNNKKTTECMREMCKIGYEIQMRIIIVILIAIWNKKFNVREYFNECMLLSICRLECKVTMNRRI